MVRPRPGTGWPERFGVGSRIRRGLENMKIQAYLTAAAINLKRLAAALLLAFITIVVGSRRDRPSPLALT